MWLVKLHQMFEHEYPEIFEGPLLILKINLWLPILTVGFCYMSRSFAVVSAVGVLCLVEFISQLNALSPAVIPLG